MVKNLVIHYAFLNFYREKNELKIKFQNYTLLNKEEFLMGNSELSIPDTANGGNPFNFFLF